MAGDWIKMRCDLDEDPSVIAIAEATGLPEDHVIGKLWKIWRWANRQLRDGNAHGVTESFVDRYLSVEGFAQAMERAGWLVTNRDGITFPNFDRHNSESVKQRALSQKRVARHRTRKSNAVCNGFSVTKPLPEKRREEKRDLEEANASCSEPASPASEPTPSPPRKQKIILTYPTVGNGAKEWHLREDKLREYQEAFPGVDVLAECRAALQWCRDNPLKRKTPRGMAAFLTRWLTKAQNSGGPRANDAASPAVDEQERQRRNQEKLKRLREERAKASPPGKGLLDRLGDKLNTPDGRAMP